MVSCPRVSVVMPVYNRAKIINQVLTALVSQDYENIEYIIVDDGSTDSTAEIIKKFSQVKYIYRKNGGCAAARNTGIASSTGDIILFVDSDVFVPSNLASIHVRYHLKYSDAIVQGQIIRIIRLEDAFRKNFSIYDYSRSFFDTANVSVKKCYIEKVGGFDEVNFRKGWEDLDIGLRLVKSGLKIKRIFKEGYVWHYEGDYSFENIIDFFNDRAVEGRASIDFLRKYPTLQVKLMTMATPFFLWLSKRIFQEEFYKSEKFYDKIRKLIEKGKDSKAISKVRIAGYCFYFAGIRERIKEEGYIL